MKYTYLSKDPEFLIIHLRRFKIENGMRVKLESLVKFPTGKLKFSKVFHQGSGSRSMDNDDLSKYSLYALV
jgi:hypothetical protein